MLSYISSTKLQADNCFKFWLSLATNMLMRNQMTSHLSCNGFRALTVLSSQSLPKLTAKEPELKRSTSSSPAQQAKHQTGTLLSISSTRMEARSPTIRLTSLQRTSLEKFKSIPVSDLVNCSL